MHRVVTDVAVSGIERVAVKRMEVGAYLAGELFEVAVVVIAERGLRHGAAVAGFLHQRAVIGDAVIAWPVHMQLFQIVVHAGVGTPGGEHNVDPTLTRGGNRIFNSR